MVRRIATALVVLAALFSALVSQVSAEKKITPAESRALQPVTFIPGGISETATFNHQQVVTMKDGRVARIYHEVRPGHAFDRSACLDVPGNVGSSDLIIITTISAADSAGARKNLGMFVEAVAVANFADGFSYDIHGWTLTSERGTTVSHVDYLDSRGNIHMDVAENGAVTCS